jgi:DNA-binding response OmpR family regulator
MAGKCVLAIEHDWRLRKLIRANLEALGLEVCEAVSEQHGLEWLRQGRVDLILLDLELPDDEALRILRALNPEPASRPTPVILISTEPPSRQLIQEGRLAGHLLKPFAIPALLDKVEYILKDPVVDH